MYDRFKELRENGKTFKDIAKELRISIDDVLSYYSQYIDEGLKNSHDLTPYADSNPVHLDIKE